MQDNVVSNAWQHNGVVGWQLSGQLANAALMHRHMCFSRQQVHFIELSAITLLETNPDPLHQHPADLTILITANLFTELNAIFPAMGSHSLAMPAQ